ncbi:MAG: serine/threonine protein kinase [Gammaproteobacteria bacterium]|nr:serine/threonine protein kinase [Gammaproteobacteria bacterium]
MQFKAIPLLAWVAIGLLLVSILPLAITAYQVKESQDSLVNQVQQTHLVSVDATADKVSSYLLGFQNLLKSIGNNPRFINNLNTEFSDELLASTLLVHDEALAIAIYANDEQKTPVQIAQKKSVSSFSQSVFAGAAEQTFEAITLNDNSYLVVRQLSNDNKHILFALIDRSELQRLLVVHTLNEAVLGLSNGQSEIIEGRINDIRQFPDNLKRLIAAQHVGSAADNFVGSGNVRQVAAFSRVAGTDWIVFSQQPADKAEIARQDMRNTSIKALIAVLLLCGLIALTAHRKIVRPIRELVASQKRLLGEDKIDIAGGEIAQLKHSFDLLQQHIEDKSKLQSISLGRYRIDDIIASGSMGTIFKGWDPRLEREIAIKTIKIGGPDSNFERHQLVEKLISEAKIIAKIAHPNIVTIYDALDSKEIAFIAMELIEGISLSDYLRSGRSILPLQTVALADGLLKGLGEAHAHSIIHKDIKPSNVLLGYNGSIKLSDFGIAGLKSQKMTGGSVVIGTPGFIAPEVISDNHYSEASDLFAVGVLLYRCLIGYNPFRGPTSMEILKATRSVAPTPPHEMNPDIPKPLSNIIMSLLIKDPSRRPTSAALVEETLQRAMGIHNWAPHFLDDTQSARKAAATVTALLPDTSTRKFIRADHE